MEYSELGTSLFELSSKSKDSGIVVAAGELRRIVEQMGGEEEVLLGKQVLELGCGSRFTPRGDDRKGWPPYFALMCAQRGAQVVGIDLYPADQADARYYHHVVEDLVFTITHSDLTRISDISDLKFDIVYSRLMDPTSPDLARTLKQHGVNYFDFRARLVQQSRGILRPKGILMLDGEII